MGTKHPIGIPETTPHKEKNFYVFRESKKEMHGN